MNKGILLASLAVLQWGAVGIFIKNIENITISGIVAGRLFLGAFFLLLIILCKKTTRVNLLESFSNIKFYMLISLVMSAHFIFATMGYTYTTVANASLLTNTMPIFVPFLAIVFLHEKINYKEFLGIIIAFIGIIIIFSSKGISFESEYFKGNVFALVSAVLLAIYTIIGSKNINKYPPLIAMFWMCLISSIMIFIGNMLTQGPLFLEINNKDIFNLIGLSIVGTFGHLCYFTCFKYIKTTTASSIAMSTPIIAMLYASIFLSEIYTLINLLGICICLIGITLTVKNKNIKRNNNVVKRCA